MDGLCVTSPNTKGEPLVFHDVQSEPSAAMLPPPKSKAVLFLSVALAFTSSMAIAGLVMSAWAIHKINGITSPITPTSVALVSSVDEVTKAYKMSPCTYLKALNYFLSFLLLILNNQ
ncbi:hypothetical protein CEUSTIGMA_g12875.t1, partial [Chlamydomonas eustigma]